MRLPTPPLPSTVPATPREAVRRVREVAAPVTRALGERLLPSPRVLAPPPAGSGLRGVPGDDGPPGIGYSLRYLSDPLAWGRRRYDVYGPVFWSNVFGTRIVSALGPEATEVVLRNVDKAYSQSGWEYFIGPFFQRGLMLLDVEEHLHHRRIMQQAFTRRQMEGYLATMQPSLARGVEEWRPAARFRWFDAIKHLLLANATDVFVGVDLGDREEAIYRAFLDTVRAGTALVRFDVPGGRWHAGLRGRQALEEFFRSEIDAKRRAVDDPSLFAALCRAETEEGDVFSDDDIVNHMIFLLMAAHDTSTITTTTMAYELGAHPEWQERIRVEVDALDTPELSYADLDKLPTVDLVMNEALRLVAPVPSLARRAVRDTDLVGYHVPAGTIVNVSPWFNHLMPELWDDPDRFDPGRFDSSRREDKVHPYAWVPFGGGVHKCIGMHFASVQIKATLNQILRRYRWSVPDGYEMPIDTVSLPIPSDGLPVRLERR